MTERVAVFGGSFDPPHMGHVLVPPWVFARGYADRVLVVPTFRHPFGKTSAPFLRRLALSRLAFRGQAPRVQVSDLESRLAGDGDGLVYTVHLLEAVARRNPGARVRLVVGSDILASGQHERWHSWPDITARFDPVVVPRAGHAPSEVCMLPEVSSREVRGRIQAGDLTWLDTRLPAALHTVLGAPPRGVVWIVGRGHVATHAGPWLSERGFDVRIVSAHAVLDGKGEVAGPDPVGVWVLTADPHISAVARALVGRVPTGVPVLHGSGSIVAGDEHGLGPLARAGHPVGTLHPICSLRSERDVSDHLHDATFGLAGSPAARKLAQDFLGGQSYLDLGVLDGGGRMAYHAACALAANHLSVLHEEAAAVLRATGPDASVAQALNVLMASSLDNLAALGLPAGVTGPVARGDPATVDRHIHALPDEAAAVYRLLSRRLTALLDRTSHRKTT